MEKTSDERSKKAAAPKKKLTTDEPIIKIDKSFSKNKRNSKQIIKDQGLLNPGSEGVSIA